MAHAREIRRSRGFPLATSEQGETRLWLLSALVAPIDLHDSLLRNAVAVDIPTVYILKLLTSENHVNHQHVQNVGRNEQAYALVEPDIIIANAVNLDGVNAS